MESSIVFLLLLQVFLIALNAVFACAEIAVISMNDAKLARMAAEGDKRAQRLVRLTSQPAKFLATIQVAITLSGFLGSAFAAENFSDSLVSLLVRLGVGIPESTLNAVAVVVITVVLSYFTLIFGELVPKRVAMHKAEGFALGMSALISGIARVFAPIVWFLTASTNLVLRSLGIDPNAEDEEVSEEEIRMMVDVGSEKGVIDHEEKRYIQNVFEFDDRTAGEIATHRTEIDLLWLDETMEDWKKIIFESRHTLYPICEESADNIVGILNAKDYFRLEDKSRENVMEYAVKPAYFVPESVKADVLFGNMKSSRNKMAVVLDEYGGMTGIVTMNDLVEQIVGDLNDDDSVEEEAILIEEMGENSWKIKGSLALEAASEVLNIPLPCENYETFNGLIFDSLGTIPQDGTSVELEAAGMHIQVVEIYEHQVEEAVISLIDNKTEETVPS